MTLNTSWWKYKSNLIDNNMPGNESIVSSWASLAQVIHSIQVYTGESLGAQEITNWLIWCLRQLLLNLKSFKQCCDNDCIIIVSWKNISWRVRLLEWEKQTKNFKLQAQTHYWSLQLNWTSFTLYPTSPSFQTITNANCIRVCVIPYVLSFIHGADSLWKLFVINAPSQWTVVSNVML